MPDELPEDLPEDLPSIDAETCTWVVSQYLESRGYERDQSDPIFQWRRRDTDLRSSLGMALDRALKHEEGGA